MLYFIDILKHTSKSYLDHTALDKALESIKEVMTYINEDKRKTEAQMVMFDIFNDIDNCPVSYSIFIIWVIGCCINFVKYIVFITATFGVVTQEFHLTLRGHGTE